MTENESIFLFVFMIKYKGAYYSINLILIVFYEYIQTVKEG